ncbi:unnamed protein product [Acanthoscelides obtectus]|uniref:Uncharacterized protein n=1 Tax=Acanthoscelides obtectus TaxID=200917 RepID=A0A9P0M6P6_ACAOB|nr:unnamed protein product [Acanthoscelides obtectus]CAK1624678.1 hypothetical protein AOBTE_LOCUS2691 [Acanthoscelides obtectus]
MVFVTLRYYATGNFLQTIGDFVGIDQWTASRIVWKCLTETKINKNSLQSDVCVLVLSFYNHPISPAVSNSHRIIRLFKKENIPHHTFPLPTERNIHAVIRGIPASTTEQEDKGELEQQGYAPFHIIRLKRNGGVPMPLVVVILPKTDKSQQVFNEHELLGLSSIVEVQKNSRLIEQCHR